MTQLTDLLYLPTNGSQGPQGSRGPQGPLNSNGPQGLSGTDAVQDSGASISHVAGVMRTTYTTLDDTTANKEVTT